MHLLGLWYKLAGWPGAECRAAGCGYCATLMPWAGGRAGPGPVVASEQEIASVQSCVGAAQVDFDGVPEAAVFDQRDAGWTIRARGT